LRGGSTQGLVRKREYQCDLLIVDLVCEVGHGEEKNPGEADYKTEHGLDGLVLAQLVTVSVQVAHLLL